jgi:endonuclease YncB( thermonuclease family)
MIGLGLKFLLVMAAFSIILLSMIPSHYQSITGSSTSSMNQTDSDIATNQSLASDKNQTKIQIPNSTRGMAVPLHNTTAQNSNLSSSIPAQATSNLVITNPDQEQQLQDNEGNQIPIPIPQSIVQPGQRPEVFLQPLYQQEPSIIQSQLALGPQISPLLSTYPEATSFIQLLQNLPTLATTYPEAPSLIQSELFLQNLPLALQTPLYYQPLSPSYLIPSDPIIIPFTECQGLAECFSGIVTSVVDGDTLDVEGIPVRLSLVDTPERGQIGYLEAVNFVRSVCGVGTEALVDEDDGQTGGSFGRLVGVVYCGGGTASLNELLLQGGYATIDQSLCGISEFSTTVWALRYGCGLIIQ